MWRVHIKGDFLGPNAVKGSRRSSICPPYFSVLDNLGVFQWPAYTARHNCSISSLYRNVGWLLNPQLLTTASWMLLFQSSFFPIWSTPFFSFSLPPFPFWHFNAFDFFCVFLILTIPFLLLLLISPRLFLYPSSLFPVSKARSIVSRLTDSSSVILLLWMTHYSPVYISHIHKDTSTDGWFYIAMCKVSVSELKRNKEIRLQLLAPNCILPCHSLASHPERKTTSCPEHAGMDGSPFSF